jgi:DNA-directed RNA polymerase subunit RPC12/RpoP
MSWKCPKCSSTVLIIEAKTEVKLIQNGEDDFETLDYGGHEWNGNSDCRCFDCGHRGEVDAFDIDLQETPDEPD